MSNYLSDIKTKIIIDGYGNTAPQRQKLKIIDSTFIDDSINEMTVISLSGASTTATLYQVLANNNNALGLGITGLANPTFAQDAVTKSYADNIAANSVAGPLTATDNAVTRFDGVTGKVLQNSLVTIDDVGLLSAPSLFATGNVQGATFNSVVVENHKARHQPGGADAIPTAAPVTQPISVGNSEGTATTFARSDHVHQMQTSTASDTGALSSSGSGTFFSRSNHTHAVVDLKIASQAQGDILYFNGTNWVRLPANTDGYVLQTHGAAANPTWSNTVNGVTVASHTARHQPGGADALTTATASTIGTVNAEGSSASLARADHTHQVTNFTLAGEVTGSVLFKGGGGWTAIAPGPVGSVFVGAGAGAAPLWSSSYVTGPGSGTDNAIARFNGADGKVIQNSVVTIGDTGAIATPQSITALSLNNIAATNLTVGGWVYPTGMATATLPTANAQGALTNNGSGTFSYVTYSSGTYTPSATVTSSCTVTPQVFQYSQTGNTVQVFGRILITRTATGAKSFRISLPVARSVTGNFALDSDAPGVAMNSGAIANMTAVTVVDSVVGTQLLGVSFADNQSTGSPVVWVAFSYFI